jgi:hypothetical protein
MIASIQKKIKAYKLIFDMVRGGHSDVLFASDFYRDLNLKDLFGSLDDQEGSSLFVSDIQEVDFFSQYVQYGGVKKEISIEMLPTVIIEHMQNTWKFNEMYNARTIAKNHPHANEYIEMVINDVKKLFNKLSGQNICGIEVGFNFRGSDYKLIAVEFTKGTLVMEFLN